MDFFSGVWNWFSGSSISSSLAKTALLGYASKLLSGSTNPGNDSADTQPDKGARLQLSPSTDNQIPVLYGEAYFGGNITDAVLSADYKKMTYCLTLAEATGEKLSTAQQTSYTFNNVYMNNNRVVFKADGFTVDYTLDSSGNQDISMRDLVKVYLYRDQTGIQPVGSSGTTPPSYNVMPGWSAVTHTMPGLIYAIVEVTYNRDKNVSGLPDCQFHITSNMTLPGDVLVDYMLSTTYGAGIDVSEIDSSFVDLNTFASTGFTYTNLSSQSTTSAIPINGIVDTTQSVLSNMEEMAKAASSWISYDIHSGKWISVINKAGSSIATFTDSNILDEISISGTSLTQLNNATDVKYQNTDILDKTDFVKIEIPEIDLYTNEPRSTLQLSLPFTNKQVVATKIGLQALKQARIDKIISFKADYSYVLLRAGDLISVTSSIYGYTNKVFRIVTATEVEGDDGAIQVEFKCLEYDADVYAYSIQQYTVTTDSGILAIGSIGKPNTPSVTKTEQANVPKIVINAQVPSGIVDAVEFWITFDVTLQNESARTYVQIGTFRNTNGTTLTEDQTVSYTYSGLSQGDFFIKVRGVNNLATGPYSDPTGLIEYVPIVVADTVSDNPVSIGGQLMSLGLLTLMNNLDKLFVGESTPGSMFDKIFSIFQEKTGYDLVGNAEGGTLVVEAPAPEPEKCKLTFGSTRYPADRATKESPEASYPNVINGVTFSGTTGDYADITGSYYFSLAGGTLSLGAGSVQLYKSSGVLAETVSASSLIIDAAKGIINIPFATRTNKTDYYILMEAGVIVDSNGCESPAITDPLIWNFHTDTPSPRPIFPPPTPQPDPNPINCTPLKFTKLTSSLITGRLSKDNLKVDIESNIGLVFNQPVTLQTTGVITINSSSGIHQTFNLAHTFANNKISNELIWVSNTAIDSTVVLNPTVDFEKGKTYWVTMDAGCVKSNCDNSGNTAISGSSTATFTTDPGPTAKSTTPAGGSTDVKLDYDRKVVPGTGSVTITDSNNNIVKTVPSTDAAVSLKEG